MIWVIQLLPQLRRDEPALNFVGQFEDLEAAKPFMGTGGHLIYEGKTLTDEGVPKSLKLVARKVGAAPEVSVEYEDVDSLT